MKKLNLLKPDMHCGYLNNGKGQEVNYLAVSEELGLKELEEDVKNGALHLKELAEFAKKKRKSRFVVINCSNEEDGLWAVSYLAAIYNKADGLDPNDYYEEEVATEKEERSFSDYSGEDYYDFEDYADGSSDTEDWEADSQWKENPWKIPVIKSSAIYNLPSAFDPYYTGGFGMGSVPNTKNSIPFWHYTRRENICIIHHVMGNYMGFGDRNDGLVNKLKRFKKNRHVFLIVIADNLLGSTFDDYEEQEYSSSEEKVCELVLEYAAGVVDIKEKKEEKEKFYAILLENWVKKAGYRLKRGFPINKITKSITAMSNPDKSNLLEKVVRYVVKEEKDTDVLTATDFDILDRFKLLGAKLEVKEQKSAKKLENELVGMENVKEQIKGIVEVMRYNKRREKLGLGAGNYHNVHMLLGAPGTAKTTVAQLLGNIMMEERLLPNNRFVAVNGAELKGMYVGHSAPKVKALFEEYDIIFIDEAYAVSAEQNGTLDSFSQEAIAQLIVELEKHGMDRLVLFAGYGGDSVRPEDNKMKAFLDSNPGIRSRINSTIFFESYTAEQMVEIFHCQAKNNKFVVTTEADELVRKFFAERVTQYDFGNGREARSLLENSMVEAAKRLANVPEEKITAKIMKELNTEDIERAVFRMQKGLEKQNGNTKKMIGFA